LNPASSIASSIVGLPSLHEIMEPHKAQVVSTYRYFFLYIEPISALTGAYYSYFQQQAYLEKQHHTFKITF